MYQIDSTGAATSLPAPLTTGIAPGFFAQTTNPSTTPTVVSADFLNMLMMELANFVTASGQTLSKSNYTQLLTALRTMTRTKLTAPLNLYVSPTGNDTATGLTVGTPFATPQKAWNTALSYDCGINNNIIINLAAGTYTTTTSLTGFPGGLGSVIFQGSDNNTPSATTISVTNNVCFTAGSGCTQVYFKGIKFVASGTSTSFSTGGVGLLATSPTNLLFYDHVEFGACGYAHMEAAGGASIILNSGAASSVPYTISGGAAYHLLATQFGNCQSVGGNITITGTPNFSSAFMYASIATSQFFSNTVTGTATGVRYQAVNNGLVNASGGLATLPGNSAGTTSAGGQAG